LTNDIEALKYKISVLDKTAFSCGQDCKRKEQQVQELTARKARLEKLIVNIVNGEDYSNLKQIVKENVKVVLSENKKLISISFVALIQTIKADPEMIKLIHNIPGANDGKQYEDDDNDNVIKYLEANKHNLLGLAEKNYENIVEALTNNAIETGADATSSSSNPTPSLPHSSYTFSSQPNQNDTYRIEDSINYHKKKGDIAD
jgi:hypothetical protein